MMIMMMMYWGAKAIVSVAFKISVGKPMSEVIIISMALTKSWIFGVLPTCHKLGPDVHSFTSRTVSEMKNFPLNKKLVSLKNVQKAEIHPFSSLSDIYCVKNTVNP